MSRDQRGRGQKGIFELTEGNDVICYTALVFLHRELAKVSEIRLTPADFDAHEARQADGIQFSLDPLTQSLDPLTQDVILRHTKPVSDA